MRPTLRLSLKGGRANQNRAAVQDLVLLLQEVQSLAVEIGRQLSPPDVPDEVVARSCQLDIVALSYGSLTPVLELGTFTEQDPNPIGLRAIQEVCRALTVLRDPNMVPTTLLPPTVVEHVDRMARLLDRGYERIESTYQYNGTTLTGVIDQQLRDMLLADQVGGVVVDGVTVQGVLFGLQDRPTERERGFFNGELSDDAGQLWSVRFARDSVDLARQLWRKHVALTGQARYSRARRPVLYVKEGNVIDSPEWYALLEQHRGTWKDLYEGESFDKIVDDLR